MPYVIAPLEDVKGLHDFPEYRQVLQEAEAALRLRASSLWNGTEPGGIFPQGKQYGVGPFRKNDMAGDTSDSTPSGSYSWTTNTTTAAAWRDLFNYTVRKDQLHGFVGFLIPDDVLNLRQLRFRFGQVSFPILDISEAHRYDRFAIIIKTDPNAELLADEKTSVLIRGYMDNVGKQDIIPLGLQAYRRVDMLINET